MNAPPTYPVDGILLIDKPSGLTSHDVVARIRRHFGFKRVGHGGTLDPMATGLLIILLGRGTKLSNFVMGTDKVYEGTITLGISTDSQDAEGEVLEEKDPSAITEDQVLEQMATWRGDMMQTPPMVSAIKMNGVPLYKLARKGKTVEREPRLIHIYSFAMQGWRHPSFDFRLACTKGTYVRTISADLGDALGCGAHLSALRRTESGAFHIDDAITLKGALEIPPEELAHRVIPPSKVQTIGPRTP